MKNHYILIFVLVFNFSCTFKERVRPEKKEIVKEGEIFELTLYPEAAEHPEVLCAKYHAHGVNSYWTGQPNRCVTGKHYFKLVRIGVQKDFASVQGELKKHGRIPCGQWIDSFKSRFLIADGFGRVGIADPSWVTSTWADKKTSYLFLSGYQGHLWGGHFEWSFVQNYKESRWLVMVD